MFPLIKHVGTSVDGFWSRWDDVCSGWRNKPDILGSSAAKELISERLKRISQNVLNVPLTFSLRQLKQCRSVLKTIWLMIGSRPPRFSLIKPKTNQHTETWVKVNCSSRQAPPPPTPPSEANLSAVFWLVGYDTKQRFVSRLQEHRSNLQTICLKLILYFICCFFFLAGPQQQGAL